ncbi:hypothetical protein GHK62_30190 [Sinorhizobium terangae]|uniref:Uncharacterized protein n=1 Tax=Sinorhizobium terangae TaxID=110322 RepID=A0A6N7LM78_SINTE|nr:exopolysaccharide production repressor protein [Sinorhizobium terangae]MQX18857.1 hypothetical protein [Sinorhizobium terangae]
MYVVSHPARSLFVTTLAYSLLLQVAYIGSVFLLVCLAAVAKMSKGLSIWVFSTRATKENQGLAFGEASPRGQG